MPLAESVTLTGQLDNRWVERNVNEFLNKALGTDIDYAVAGDTDSLYITINNFVDKYVSDKSLDQQVEFADKFCKKLQIKIDEFVGRLNQYTNAKNPTIEYSREAIAACIHPTTKVNGQTVEELYSKHRDDCSTIITDDCVECVEVIIPTESFNAKTLDVADDKIYAIMRKRYKGMMYTFETNDGTVLTVTEDHKIAVLRDNGFTWIEAKNVLETDVFVEVE